MKNVEVKMNIQQFQEDLISWFVQEQRSLPWRQSSDPYKIWVSEVMLQQTRVDTVIPYYQRFIENYPTLESFAAADEESILKIWEGLGYYSRVRNLHTAVKEVVESYDSKVPDNREAISKLKGVGPYTAGAILSIAYGKPEPAVDGNVMRVLSRILLIQDDIAKQSTRKKFEHVVREIIDVNNPSDFNQALMELGALICTPTSPSCLLCPVREHCLAFQNGVEEQLPVKTRKKSVKHVELMAVVLKTNKDQYVIRKRPEKGLLANLWEFPMVEANGRFEKKKETVRRYLESELHTTIEIQPRPFCEVDHVFSHLTWKLHVYTGHIVEQINCPHSYQLVTAMELEQYAFPVSHQKIWKAYQDQYLSEKGEF